MRCSIARCAWAIACICSSVAAGPSGAALGDGARPDAALRSAELELELARRPELYLRLDPAGGALEVKARRLSLVSVALFDARAFVHHGGGHRPAALELPLRWRVLEAPPGVGREVLEATALRPYDAQGEGAAASPASAGSGDPKPPPAAYRVSLSEGWVLRIGAGRAGRGVPGRVGLGARRLLAALRGEPFQPPPILALTLNPEDARRLHHLFRPGLEILVVAPAG